MVLGLLLGLAVPIAAGVPTTIGVAESVSYQQKANESVKDDEKRMVKFAVEVYCEGGEEVMSTATGQGEGKGKGRGDEKGKGKGRGRGEREVHGRRLGLRDGKVGLFLVGAFFFLGGQLVDWWDGGDGGMVGMAVPQMAVSRREGLEKRSGKLKEKGKRSTARMALHFLPPLPPAPRPQCPCSYSPRTLIRRRLGQRSTSQPPPPRPPTP